eukprot:TRINITY_DN4568_c0_g1_i7.p1 TRINITY_DN4568_c0_g1~~TRINITY_DN4568_c0_g1_i7.p1  ORF type:complete len:351 (-),score=65.72 TRINITY_DN4568_c0_g1_i7:633-1685(-)
MSLLQTVLPNPRFLNPNPKFLNPNPLIFFSSSKNPKPSKPLRLSVSAAASDPNQNPNPNPNPNADPNPSSKPPRRGRRPKPATPQNTNDSSDEIFPSTIPSKPRRGRRSKALAVEDFVRDSLERTFVSIRKQNSGVLDGKEEILKKRIEEPDNEDDDEDDDEDVNDGRSGKKVVEEDDPDWPVDTDVGWGIRASDYFEQYPIKNVVVDGVEIDWEGELDDSWVKEINILEWEGFAFHPSPLMVLVFERYNRAADNWRLLKELEKAIKVYWNAKDRLPPRTVKFDVNIEKDLAYALKVKECPQLLFLRGQKIMYREKEFRTADELVQMIAHFYYNAKKPSWIDDAFLAPPI